MFWGGSACESCALLVYLLQPPDMTEKRFFFCFLSIVICGRGEREKRALDGVSVARKFPDLVHNLSEPFEAVQQRRIEIWSYFKVRDLIVFALSDSSGKPWFAERLRTIEGRIVLLDEYSRTLRWKVTRSDSHLLWRRRKNNNRRVCTSERTQSALSNVCCACSFQSSLGDVISSGMNWKLTKGLINIGDFWSWWTCCC